LRRDAERNRRKLILAASEVMRAEGGDVPMEAIAERAGLTRGTLYRNFAHRQEMYEAVLEHDLDHLAEAIARESGADPLAFIRLTTEMMMVYEKFLVALSAMEDYDFQTNQARMIATIAPALTAAQAQGHLRSSLTGDDILMACRMLSTHLRLDDPQHRGDAIALRLKLFLEGLAPPTGQSV
jgi:AcrR family transcriptional regulator